MDDPTTNRADKSFNVERDAATLLDLIENGNLSEIEDISDDDDDDTDIILPDVTSAAERVGAEVIRHNQEQQLEEETFLEEETPINNDHFTTPRERVKWRRKTFTQPPMEPFEIPVKDDPVLRSPVEYFKNYFTDELFEDFATYTNM